MVILKLTLDLYGKSFIPTKLADILGSSVHVIFLDDVYNTISIEKPSGIGINNYMISYEKWYVDFLDKYYVKLLELGVERFDICISVFFFGQCNFEIFTNQMLQNLSRKNVSLPISVFKVTKEEIESILLQKDYSISEIDVFLKEETI